jgi:hypothetical protein
MVPRKDGAMSGAQVKCTYKDCQNLTVSVTGVCTAHRKTVCKKCRRVFTRTKIGQETCKYTPCYRRKQKDYLNLETSSAFSKRG